MFILEKTKDFKSMIESLTLKKQRRANKTQGKQEEWNNRAEINEIESRKTIEKSMTTKANSFEKKIKLINSIQTDQEKN